MNKDDIDDAQLDAFLNGKDDLSRRLQALAQPAPDAALDDAILARAQQAMAADQRREAANDPGTPTRMRPLSWRWRLPAALAATVLVGVVAKQSFDATRDLQVAKQAEMNEVLVEMRVPPPPPPPETIVRESPAAVSAAPAPARAPAAPPVADIGLAPMEAKPAAPAAAAPAVEVPAPTPPVNNEAPADVARDALRAPPKVSGALEEDKQRKEQQYADARAKSTETASRALQKSEAGFGAAQRQRQAVAAAPSAEAQAWLERIEALLKAGADKEALEEWKKFRAAYPDHPVPDAVSARLRAISQQ